MRTLVGRCEQRSLIQSKSFQNFVANRHDMRIFSFIRLLAYHRYISSFMGTYGSAMRRFLDPVLNVPKLLHVLIHFMYLLRTMMLLMLTAFYSDQRIFINTMTTSRSNLMQIQIELQIQINPIINCRVMWPKRIYESLTNELYISLILANCHINYFWFALPLLDLFGMLMVSLVIQILSLQPSKTNYSVHWPSESFG